MKRREGRRARARRDWRVVHQVASWCLEYPTPALLERTGLLRDALEEQVSSAPVDRLLAFLDHLEARPLPELVDEYIRLFDLSRDQTLYLTYWTDGDTRRRGSTLAALKQRYRASGFVCDTRGELPDHLPLVLEYAALGDEADGRQLLEEYRASLELIRLALLRQDTAYARLLEGVCGTLPGPSPRNRAEAMALVPDHLRDGPPAESVGVELLGYPTVRGAGTPVAAEGAH